MNDLIERYVHEVGRHLPRRGRQDIQQELRSLLEDTVEERAGGEEPTEQLLLKVLTEFGKPEEMAANYKATQYVIGPDLYPTFRTVITVVLAVMSVFYLVILAAVLWRGDSADLVSTIWGGFLDYGNRVLSSLGIITLIFIGIEHFFGDQIGLAQESAEWDPTTLPSIDDPYRVNYFELGTELIATVIFGSIFVSLVVEGGAWHPFFTEDFRPNLGWLIASIVTQVILHSFVLWQGRWQPLTRWLEFANEVFGLYVLYRIVSAGSIINIEIINGFVTTILYVAMIIITVVATTQLARLLFGHKPTTVNNGQLSVQM